jgi:hypothetical protein
MRKRARQARETTPLMHVTAEAMRLQEAELPARALKVLQDAQRRWPGEGSLWGMSALMHMALGDLLAARADLAVALALEPAAGAFSPLLLTVLSQEGQPEAAEAVLEAFWERSHAIAQHSELDKDALLTMIRGGPGNRCRRKRCGFD